MTKESSKKIKLPGKTSLVAPKFSDTKPAPITAKKRIVRKSQAKTFDELLNKKVSQTKLRGTIVKELAQIKKTSVTARPQISPYSYIYSDTLKTGKYDKIVRAVENRLTDLGIAGRIHRLSQFKNLEEIIEEDMKRGINNVIVVGDDVTLMRAIEALADFDVVMGFIPIGEDSAVSDVFGIPDGVAACDTLSQRIIQPVDLGRINGKLFFSSVEIEGQKMPFVCDGTYKIYSDGGMVRIFNFNLDLKEKNLPKIDPSDGRFEILVHPKEGLGSRFGFFSKKPAESLFFARVISIASDKAFAVTVDKQKNLYKNVEIEVLPQKLKMVMGRGRRV
jgi:diacylglycerol kinase family enzyme